MLSSFLFVWCTQSVLPPTIRRTNAHIDWRFVGSWVRLKLTIWRSYHSLLDHCCCTEQDCAFAFVCMLACCLEILLHTNKLACIRCQRLECTHLHQREQMQQLRAEQQQLRKLLDQLDTIGQCQPDTSGQYQLTGAGHLHVNTGQSAGHQYRVHSSLSECSSGSLSSSTGYSSSEHGRFHVFVIFISITSLIWTPYTCSQKPKR